MGLKVAVQMDPIERILPDKDTTFVFMLESQARQHAVYEILGGLRPLQCHFQIVFQVAHIAISPTVRASLSRSMASERCKWLFTVATGMSSTCAMSVGSRSSW